MLVLLAILCHIHLHCFAQQQPIRDELQRAYNQTKSIGVKIEKALSLVDSYIAEDKDDSAQLWLYKIINHNEQKQDPHLAYLILTRQAEVYYFSNLPLFGLQAAHKGLAKAAALGDSLFMADALAFQSYLYESTDSLELSKNKALAALKIYPKLARVFAYPVVEKSQIINQVAQLYLRFNQLDSAFYFNNMALTLAQKDKHQRAIAMCLNTNGRIHALKQQNDSALYYFNKSKSLCVGSELVDLLLLNESEKLLLQQHDWPTAKSTITSNLTFIDSVTIGPYYQQLFFKNAIHVIRLHKDKEFESKILARVLTLQEQAQSDGNKLVQNVAEQYVLSENNLMKTALDQSNQHKKNTSYKILGLFAIVIILGLAFFFYLQKKKSVFQKALQQQQLIQKERERIAEDMQNELGTGLTKITFLSQMAIAKADVDSSLKNIQQTTAALVDSMNDLLWTMKEENNKLNQLSFYIQQYLQSYCEKEEIIFNFSVKEDTRDRMVTAETRHNVLLALKELVFYLTRFEATKSLMLVVDCRADLSIEIMQPNLPINKNWAEVIKKHPTGLAVAKRMVTLGGSINYKAGNSLSIELNLPI